MSNQPNRLKSLTSVIEPQATTTQPESKAVDPTTDDFISEDEAAMLRQEKLAAIKRAVEAGAYDSDELLEKAMQRMKQSIERENAPE